MCMVFYLGSSKQLPLIPYDVAHPAFNSKEPDESQMAVRRHFTIPYITYVGSYSGCGCGFRYALKDQDGWTPVVGEEEMQDESVQDNQESLYSYIKSHVTEGSVELFACWDGDYDEQAESREVIAIEEILDKDFYFKERGFYTITISD